MAANNGPVFLVDATSNPVLIRVRGRASFQNSQLIRDYIQQVVREGRRRFVIDFAECTGMDSTFLGVLAGAALELRKAVPVGSLVFGRLGQRNLELVRNLGLHRLATVDTGEDLDTLAREPSKALDGPKLGELEAARLVLDAHKNLVQADESNRARFQDVITLLKGRVDQG
jgi:anti-sigma B factor antagonist